MDNNVATCFWVLFCALIASGAAETLGRLHFLRQFLSVNLPLI